MNSKVQQPNEQQRRMINYHYPKPNDVKTVNGIKHPKRTPYYKNESHQKKQQEAFKRTQFIEIYCHFSISLPNGDCECPHWFLSKRSQHPIQDQVPQMQIDMQVYLEIIMKKTNKPRRTKAQAAPTAKPVAEYIQKRFPYSIQACLQKGSIMFP